jgi:radical SAM protein with 4Fe4S-binding SPASM domain
MVPPDEKMLTHIRDTNTKSWETKYMPKSWKAEIFQPEVPEIYQIELTNMCNLNCGACIRLDKRVERPIGFLSLDLLKTMIARKDFAGSYFVELQMYGEPLLYPALGEVIKMLKAEGLKVGLSTNGILIPNKLKDLAALDYMTISMDSAQKPLYEMLRPGSMFGRLVDNIDAALDACPDTKIDLQVINFYGLRDELPDLVAFAAKRGWTQTGKLTCRAVPDCFAAYQDRPFPKDRINHLCLNPWLSVSVQWDGDVVPCCFSAGKAVVYGNLYNSGLETIWEISKQRQWLMNRMRHDFNVNNMPCMLCYLRSPALFHLKMLQESNRLK